MEMSILLAKILGVYMVLFAVAMLINRDRCSAILADFENSVGLSSLATSIGIILGLVLINMHNIWVQDWHVVITVIAWLVLVSSVGDLFFPKQMSDIRKNIHTGNVHTVKSLICLVVGGFLLYHGYNLGTYFGA